MRKRHLFDGDDPVQLDEETVANGGSVDDGTADATIDDLHESIAAMQRQNERRNVLPLLLNNVTNTAFHVRTNHPRPITFAPALLESLHKLTATYVERIAVDCEHFAKHAKRTRITVDDVLLTTRHNPSLNDQMTAFISANGLSVPPAKKRRAVADKVDRSIDNDDEYELANTHAQRNSKPKQPPPRRHIDDDYTTERVQRRDIARSNPPTTARRTTTTTTTTATSRSATANKESAAAVIIEDDWDG